MLLIFVINNFIICNNNNNNLVFIHFYKTMFQFAVNFIFEYLDTDWDSS